MFCAKAVRALWMLEDSETPSKSYLRQSKQGESHQGIPNFQLLSLMLSYVWSPP